MQSQYTTFFHPRCHSAVVQDEFFGQYPLSEKDHFQRLPREYSMLPGHQNVGMLGTCPLGPFADSFVSDGASISVARPRPSNAHLFRHQQGPDPDVMFPPTIFPTSNHDSYPHSVVPPEIFATDPYSTLNSPGDELYKGTLTGSPNSSWTANSPPDLWPQPGSVELNLDLQPKLERDGSPDEDDVRGDQPYANLIYECLRGAPNHQMKLREIYGWFEHNTTKARDSSGKNGWQNSIRHNLSMNQAFENDRSSQSCPSRSPPSPFHHSNTAKTPSSSCRKANSVWSLTDFALHHGIQSTTRYRKNGSNKKPLNRTKPPAPQRQRSGAKGGKAAKRSLRARKLRLAGRDEVVEGPEGSVAMLGMGQDDDARLSRDPSPLDFDMRSGPISTVATPGPPGLNDDDALTMHYPYVPPATLPVSMPSPVMEGCYVHYTPLHADLFSTSLNLSGPGVGLGSSMGLGGGVSEDEIGVFGRDGGRDSDGEKDYKRRGGL